MKNKPSVMSELMDALMCGFILGSLIGIVLASLMASSKQQFMQIAAGTAALGIGIAVPYSLFTCLCQT